VIKVERASDLAAYAGQRIGHSRPAVITQPMIDGFAELTGDDHWIHVDTERAAREMPGGRTIAHGLLVLSLAPRLKDDVYAIRLRGKGLNYGYDRIRFVRPVPVGSVVRLAVTIVAVTPHKAGTRIDMLHEIEDAETGELAISAQNIVLIAEG
jgi:acyl dehydratase